MLEKCPFHLRYLDAIIKATVNERVCESQFLVSVSMYLICDLVTLHISSSSFFLLILYGFSLLNVVYRAADANVLHQLVTLFGHQWPLLN